MLRRGPSLPSISPHAPVRVRVRACASVCASACPGVPVRERARLCPEVRACPAVRALACPVLGACARCPPRAVCARRACGCALACCACVPVRLPSRVLASRACAGVCVTSRVLSRCLPRASVRLCTGWIRYLGDAVTVPGCGGRHSTAGLSSGLHPRRSRLSSAYSAVSFLYLVQCYCGGSISRVLAVPLETVLGPRTTVRRVRVYFLCWPWESVVTPNEVRPEGTLGSRSYGVCRSRSVGDFQGLTDAPQHRSMQHKS